MKNKFFDDHYPVILINNTSTNFISLIKGCAFVMNKETKKTTWYLPLTPKLVIFFVNNDDWEKMFNKATQMDLNDKESIDYYNDLIAQCEICEYHNRIVGNHRLKMLVSNDSFSFCYNLIMEVRGGFNPKGYYLAPLSKSKGYDSKTMAYSIYHLARIEDIVCYLLLKNDEQIFIRNNYQKRLKINIKTTGNELKSNEIISFSKQIALNELFSYFTDVYLESNEFINNLEFQDLKIKISEDKKQYLYDTDYVSKDEDSIWLIDYWCNKNTLGLLKMPFSRHWIMHSEVFLKIKNEIVRKAKKENKNKIAVCGFSCSHCFLGEWCGGCRTEYNCCSFGTLFEGGICPNVKCAGEKEIEVCHDCSLLDTYEKGFYVRTNNGAGAAKASAMFIRKYGKKNL